MAKVTSVQPVIDHQTSQQRTWSNRDGKINYTFFYVLDNGMRGECSHQSPQPRFPVGSEVTATDATQDQRYPKLKLENPNGGGKFGGGGRGSDPSLNARLQAAGLVQAAITAGAKTEADILAVARLGLSATKTLQAEIMAATPAAPAAAPQPMGQPQHPQAQAQNPFPQQGQHAVGQMPVAQPSYPNNPFANPGQPMGQQYPAPIGGNSSDLSF